MGFHRKQRKSPPVTKQKRATKESDSIPQNHDTENNNDLECDICSKVLSSRWRLAQHKKLHENKRDFKCTLCPSAFITKHNLRQHLMNLHGINPWPCSQCNQSFRRKCDLMDHQEKDHSVITRNTSNEKEAQNDKKRKLTVIDDSDSDEEYNANRPLKRQKTTHERL